MNRTVSFDKTQNMFIIKTLDGDSESIHLVPATALASWSVLLGVSYAGAYNAIGDAHDNHYEPDFDTMFGTVLADDQATYVAVTKAELDALPPAVSAAITSLDLDTMRSEYVAFIRGQTNEEV